MRQGVTRAARNGRDRRVSAAARIVGTNLRGDKLAPAIKAALEAR